MYNNILDGLFLKKNILSNQQKQEYLVSLQEPVRSIRRAYIESFPIRFDYQNPDVQAGYLITYVPHYTDLTHYALRNSGSEIANANLENLVFIGSGPCPEIVGYLRYILEFNNKVKDIRVNIYDKSIEEWKWSRDIVFSNLVPNFSNGISITRNEGKIDISQEFSVKFNDSKRLVVFQNCLNEINSNTHNVLIKNVDSIFSSMSSGSYLLLIDLYFWQVRDLIIAAENHIKTNYDCTILHSINEGTIEHRTLQDNEPNIILDNLLIDRFGAPNPNYLLPKRNLKFIYTFIKKN
jgi:hypothetical protein